MAHDHGPVAAVNLLASRADLSGSGYWLAERFLPS